MAFIPPLLAAMGAGGAASATAGLIGGSGLLAAGGTSAITAAATPALSGIASSALGSLATVGTLTGALGALASSNQQAAAMEANADLAKREAAQIQEAGKSQAYKLSQERNQMMGAQRAAYGASGVDLAGSTLEVMARTYAQYSQDINQTGWNATVKAQNSLFESDLYKYGARNKRMSGYIDAGNTLLSGYGKSLLAKGR